eukprot:UN30409
MPVRGWLPIRHKESHSLIVLPSQEFPGLEKHSHKDIINLDTIYKQSALKGESIRIKHRRGTIIGYEVEHMYSVNNILKFDARLKVKNEKILF